MAKVIITKNYLDFCSGEKYLLIESKQRSLKVKRNGKFYHIPKTHCEAEGGLSGVLGANDWPPYFTPAPAPTPTPTPKVRPKVSLRDNQVQMSHFTKGVLPKSGVDHIINMYSSEHFPEELWEFIPDFNCNYVWNADVLESVILGCTLDERVFLVGMPGTGKTTAHEQYAAIIGQPFYQVNGKDSMEASSFLGSLGTDGAGQWAWMDGTLPMCMKLGFYLCIDEVTKIPAGIQMALQTVWQKRGKLVLDDKPGSLVEKLVKPVDNFRIVATDNTRGLGDNFSLFGATQVQDTSTLDRFGVVQEVDYLSEDDEGLLLERLFPEVNTLVTRRLIQVANFIREGYKSEDFAVTLSQRGLRAACGMIMQGLPPRIAFDKAYTAKLADDTQIAAVGELCSTAHLT